MSSSPPSVGNRVKLDPLSYNVNSVAYNTGYIELATVEPSLGLPTGFTFTETGSTYYFPIFGIANSYANSRRFTGNDSLVFKNKNLGINNPNPTYNVDVSGSIKATNATFETLEVDNILGQQSLIFNFVNGVNFNSPVYFNNNTYFNNVVTDNISTYILNADTLEYNNTLIQIYNLYSANISSDLNITGKLTASDIFVNNAVTCNNLSAINSNFELLSAGNVTVASNLKVHNNIYANNIYGKIAIDDSSQLFYNENNQLSISKIKDYYFVIRPSDSYSTDDINIARTLDGPKDDGTIDNNFILKPFFKNVQAVIDYVYTNGIYGNNLTIWVDEDITAGEDRENAYTPDRSGYYSGCTITGNISSVFLSNKYIEDNLPSLYVAGLRGGDYIWAKNNNYDITGKFYYIELYPINFNAVKIQGRYEIGTYTNNYGLKEYTTWKPFNYPVRTILFRTYICSDPNIPFGSFNLTDINTWTSVYTKTTVQGRQIQFNQSKSVDLTLTNLCFSFETNSVDSTGLVFYDGNNNIQNITVSLKGTGVYTYGAINVESEYATVNILGTPLMDPYFVNFDQYGQTTWNTWNSYGFDNPNYFPGYGLAIIGNTFPVLGTIINFNESTPYSGFINIRNGGQVKILDQGTRSRTFGYYSYIQNCIILDGGFVASSFFNVDNRSSLTVQQNLFKTLDFYLISNFINYNNKRVNDTFKLTISNTLNNFKYINFSGSFATFTPIADNTLTRWSFRIEDAVPGPQYNTFLSVNNNFNDGFYIFNSNIKPFTAILNNSLNSIGRINYMSPTAFNTNNIIYYVGQSGIKNYNENGIYNLNSPTLAYESNYTLNFKTGYTR
jgi:hypothetical protein